MYHFAAEAVKACEEGGVGWPEAAVLIAAFGFGALAIWAISKYA